MFIVVVVCVYCYCVYCCCVYCCCVVYLQDEQERIQAQGGFVMHVGDQWRVGGNLAVSRAIGKWGNGKYDGKYDEVLR